MAKILVVDDHPTNRELVVTLARHRGHATFEAADGAEALEIVARERPDLVVCDILMPTMDGYEFVRRLRADAQLAATEVMFYSAHYHEQEAKNLARDCGVTRVIGKPCEPAELLKAIDDSLAHRAPAPAAVPADFDREHLRLMTDQLTAKAAELENRNSRLSALTQLNLQLASEANYRTLLDKVCAGARELIGASLAILLVRDKYDDGHTHVSVAGISRELLQTLPAPLLEAGWLGTVYRERRPGRMQVGDGDPRALGLPRAYPAMHAALAVPVASLTHEYGWLLLANKLGQNAFTDEDEAVLNILGAQVGRVYENGSLYHQLQVRAQQLQTEISARERTAEALVGMLARQEALRLIDERILAAHSPSDVARVALEHLRSVLPYWMASVVVLEDEERLKVLARASTGESAPPRFDRYITLEQYGAADVAALRQGLVCNVPDLAAGHDLPSLAEAMALVGMRCYVRVPMMAEGAFVGALNLAADEPDYFSADQIEFARSIAAHLGIAIQQSLLREHISRQSAELEQKVLERTAQLQAAVEELQSFSYSVSHDLRAPLRAIEGFARALEEDQQDRMDEHGRSLLAIIRRSSQRMDQLINDLLKFAQTGRAELITRDLDTNALVAEVRAGLATEKPTTFEIENLPRVRADLNLLRQVWVNLLSNAAKYSSKQAQPLVRVSAEQTEKEVVFRVSDNGVGFDERYAAKLFAVFQRLHSDREFPGTGVGLAIVHRIVSRHGGRVWAQGAVGQGANFYFSLPRRAEESGREPVIE